MTEDTPDRESFICVFLNTKNKIITIETVSKGTLTAATIYPREVVKRALELGAVALIVAHNLCKA